MSFWLTFSLIKKKLPVMAIMTVPTLPLIPNDLWNLRGWGGVGGRTCVSALRCVLEGTRDIHRRTRGSCGPRQTHRPLPRSPRPPPRACLCVSKYGRGE